MLPLDEIKKHTPIVKYVAIHSITATIIGAIIIGSVLWAEREHCIGTMTQCNISKNNDVCYWFPIEHDITDCVYHSSPNFGSNMCGWQITSQNRTNITTPTDNTSWILTNCSYDPDRNRCPTTNCAGISYSPVSSTLLLLGFGIIAHPLVTILIYGIFCLPFTKRLLRSTDLPGFS